WESTPNMGLCEKISSDAGILFGRTLQLFAGKTPMGFHIRRGSVFLTQLRLQWVKLQEIYTQKQIATSQSVGQTAWEPPLVVQLLGSEDNVVGPDDGIDIVTGQDFIYLDMPFTDHEDITNLEAPPQQGGVPLCPKSVARYKVFKEALTASRIKLQQIDMTVEDAMLPPPDLTVTDVVFVVHGIRDRGFWTKKIGNRVVQRFDQLAQAHIPTPGVQPPKAAMVTSTYGYFPMLPFLFSEERRLHVRWLMRQYARTRALFPKADFHYVGHSNGTFLAAMALQEYPACRFSRIVFAGSVVNGYYNWKRLVKEGKIDAMLNYTATGDLVVAWFPNIYQCLGSRELGGGGHDGFRDMSPTGKLESFPQQGWRMLCAIRWPWSKAVAGAVAGAAANSGAPPPIAGTVDSNGNLHQLRYITGGHGSGITESRWDEIADFVATKTVPLPHTTGMAPDRKFWIVWASFPPFPVWLGAIGLTLGVLWLIWWLTHSPAILIIVIYLIYLALISF
ncbi:MAG: hypothetical protein ACAI35_25215, partial [Candidatus Methylacidiphilales bacterium]